MSQIKVNTINDASGGNNAVLYGPACPDNSMGFRNRIINGDMRIDQRNNGASVTANSSAAPYCPDRFNVNVGGSTAAYSCQQVTDSPVGFVNSLKLTVTTAATLSASQFTFARQIIEGYNIADLSWGTASASSVAISFWVKSSLTGTFAVACINSAEDRSYPATFVINSANTWEYKTIIVPGDTSGTWLTNNSNGIRLAFDLGAGSNYNGTANTWQAGWKQRTSGCVSFSQTSGATFYITGVQLEAGSVATPFERRPYGTELALCQRYYEVMGNGCTGGGRNATTAALALRFQVQKRATPTMTQTASCAGIFPGITGTTVTGIFATQTITTSGTYVEVHVTNNPGTSCPFIIGNAQTPDVFAASAEL